MQAATGGAAWLEEVKARVEERLEAFFDEKRAAALRLAPQTEELVEAVAQLTLRGGKRFRPALMVAAFRAVAPEEAWVEVIDAGAALELMQTYLLIHDDWMDADDERRGGPAVHAWLRDRHGGDRHLGDSLAILAGNLASAQAWDLLARGVRREPARSRAIDVFLDVHQEVVFGQQLDLLGDADVPRMQRLKTGSYTVRGPIALGAVLGEATDDERAALEAFAEPLGEAFQMRDDLLGTFGDPARTGKPSGGDLRAGKRTSLVRALESIASVEQAAAVRAVLGRADAGEDALQRAREALIASGARQRVEARLAELVREATQSLAGAPLRAPGVDMLRELADRLAVRDR